MAKKTEREQIARAEAARLMKQVQSLGLLLKASVVRRRFRCGKPGYRCVRQGRETEALAWLENWRRLKQILSRLTDGICLYRRPTQATP